MFTTNGTRKNGNNKAKVCPTCGRSDPIPTIAEAKARNGGKRVFTLLMGGKTIGRFKGTNPQQAAKKAANRHVIDGNDLNSTHRFRMKEILDDKKSIYGKTFEFKASRRLYPTPRRVPRKNAPGGYAEVKSFIQMEDPY